MTNFEDERHTHPRTGAEVIIRYAAEAALAGSGVKITDSWVCEVLSSFRKDPSRLYPEGVEADSPLTTAEIAAHLQQVPPHAKNLRLHFKDGERTVVIVPYEFEYDTTALRFDHGVGIYDDSTRLILEYINKRETTPVHRVSLDKPTGLLSAEQIGRGSRVWTPIHAGQEVLTEQMRANLKQLRFGAYSGLGHLVRNRRLVSPELNDMRF